MPLSARQPEPGSIRPIDFRANVGLNADQLQAVENGEAVAMIMDTPLHREVDVFGVVWVEAPMSLHLSGYTDITFTPRSSFGYSSRMPSAPAVLFP